LAIVLVLVVLAVGTAVVLVDLASQGGNRVASGPPSHPATQPPTTTTAPATTDDNGPPTFTAMSDLVRQYYDLLPDNVTAAYQLLSPAYQAQHPFSEVQSFYGGIRQVSASGFREVGTDTVDAVIMFVRQQDGVTTHEPYGFTVVRRHGRLVIDKAVQLTRTNA
jgi:hypothetical protein